VRAATQPTMLSKSVLLLKRGLFSLGQDDAPWGISASADLPDDDVDADKNTITCHATIEGLRGTSWEGGTFRLALRYNLKDDSSPPDIYFITIPYHPNIDAVSGKPCVDFLDNAAAWAEGMGLDYMLLSLQTLLAFPVLDSPVNETAAAMLMANSGDYETMIRQCVAATKVAPVPTEPMASPGRGKVDFVPFVCVRKERKQKPVSFDDYYRSWSKQATTLTASNKLAATIKVPEVPDPSIIKQHTSVCMRLAESDAAQGLSSGIGFKKWMTDEEHRSAAMMEKFDDAHRLANRTPSASSAGQRVDPSPVDIQTGGLAEDEGDLDAEAAELLDFAENLDVDEFG